MTDHSMRRPLAAATLAVTAALTAAGRSGSWASTWRPARSAGAITGATDVDDGHLLLGTQDGRVIADTPATT
jgi:hypothetical protein